MNGYSVILLLMGNLIPEITYWRKYVRSYIIKENRTYFRKKGAYIMRKEDEERKEMSRERMEEKEILDLYRNLNKNQKQRIKIIMRGMKGKVF